MIVMKFGGSSLASADSIRRVIPIIRSELDRHPVVIASAMGDTTDHLLQVLSAAHTADRYSAWKLQQIIKDQHFGLCDELLSGDRHVVTDQYLRAMFLNLHLQMLKLCEGEWVFTPQLQDWTLSLGEQLSSRILAAVLQEHVGSTVHMDSRKLILTDSEFTKAHPLAWETYARIRWSIPAAARDKIVVVGGFIGGTADGRTTTLGRGGSDLTASIIGAAVNADEIQIWKDVDGMLTCDPRLGKGGHRVKRLSYEEATALAGAGATILHPDTMAPAKRLRIPIIIRNTFQPACEGTRIDSGRRHCPALVKSIAARPNTTLLEVRAVGEGDNLQPLLALCRQHGSATTVLFSSANVVYIAMEPNGKLPEESLAPSHCLEVKMLARQAILSVVGQHLDKELVSTVLNHCLRDYPAFLIPAEDPFCGVRVAIRQQDLESCLALVHQAFFTHPDPEFFGARQSETPTAAPAKNRSKRPRALALTCSPVALTQA